MLSIVIGHAVVDDSLSPKSPLGDSVDVFVRREDASCFVEEVRGDEPEVASYLRIEERELEAGGLNCPPASLHISSVRAPPFRRSRRSGRSIP